MEVEAATIPELVDLMRRYADVDETIQHALLLDTPPSLRNDGAPVHIKTTHDRA